MGTYLETIRTGNKNDQISLEIYKGTLSINSTWQGNKGTMDNMIYNSEWKDGAHQPGDRRPLRIRLGDPDTTYRILTQLAQAAKKEAEAQKGQGQNPAPHLEAPRGLPVDLPWEGKVKQAEEVFRPSSRPTNNIPEDDIPF
jgi:hypothetical protein